MAVVDTLYGNAILRTLEGEAIGEFPYVANVRRDGPLHWTVGKIFSDYERLTMLFAHRTLMLDLRDGRSAEIEIQTINTRQGDFIVKGEIPARA
jgi:hypothetical protein